MFDLMRFMSLDIRLGNLTAKEILKFFKSLTLRAQVAGLTGKAVTRGTIQVILACDP